VGTQVVTALGVGYDILPRELLAATLEAWALPGLDTQKDVTVPAPGAIATAANGAHMTPAEWHLSLRTAPVHGGDFSTQAGGGGGPPLGGDTPVPTPHFRFPLALRWAPHGGHAAPAAAKDGDGAGAASARAASGGPSVELHLAAAPDRCQDPPDL